MLNTALADYRRRFENLKIDRAHGPAPHKPILLLSVIELIEQGRIAENLISFTPELVETFRKYWIELTDRVPNVAMPFFHLQSDGFWHLHPNPGFEAALKATTQIRKSGLIREVVSHATMDDKLFGLLLNPESREVLRQAIIETYFSERRLIVMGIIEQGRKISRYESEIIRNVENEFKIKEAAFEPRPEVPVRNAAFRRAIMSIYNYTCSVCRLRIVSMDGESAVDAAHIIPFSQSYNDDPRNGYGLCKLHHWAFDIGLVSVDSRYQVLVSPLLDGNRPTEWLLTQLRGQPILLPAHERFYPSAEAFDWHREHKLQS